MRGVIRGFLGVLGIIITLFSGLCFTMGVGELLRGTTEFWTAIGLLIFFGGAVVAGALLARANLMQPASQSTMSDSTGNQTEVSDLEIEQRILSLAETTDCSLTIPEVALRCDLSVAASKTALDRMVAQGIAEAQFTSEGQFAYAFSGLQALGLRTSGLEDSEPGSSHQAPLIDHSLSTPPPISASAPNPFSSTTYSPASETAAREQREPQ